MTAPARRLTASPSSPAPAAGAKVIPFARKQSSGNGFGQRSLAAQRECDPLTFYAAFPDRWQAFLRAQFRNAFEVAVFFSVTEKAAEKWWEGIGGPQGAKLGYALSEIPGAIAQLFGEAA